MFVLQSLIVGIFVTLVVYYANYQRKRRRFNELAKLLPGRDGLPIIGYLHKFAIRGYRDYLDVYADIPRKDETLTKFWMGPVLMLMINSPENLQFVLNSPKCHKKAGVLYNMWDATEGLVLNHGNTWKRHRKILNASFTLNVLQKLFPMFQEKSLRSIQLLEKHVGKGSFDVYENVAACSLETLMKGNFNFDRDYQTEPHKSDLLMTMENGRERMMIRLFQVWNNYEPLFKLSRKLYRDVKGLIRFMRESADEVIAEQEKLNSNNEKLQIEESVDESISNRSLINLLLDPKNNFSYQEINDEICTFLIAGHETTAVSIASILLMLAMHKDIQEKVIEEIDSITMQDGLADYDSAHKLTYLEMVIKETMRLFPVLPLVARETTGEIELDGYVIPEGTILNIFAFGTHRNENYWGEDASLFKPSRFEPENIRKVHQYAYIPFTGGSRICIGWRYAMLFMKVYLANFFRHYTVDTPLKYNEITLTFSPSIIINQKHMISLAKRKTN